MYKKITLWHAPVNPSRRDLRVNFNTRNTVYYADEEIEVVEDTYYAPNSAQQVGIDAFFFHRKRLYLLQYTVSSRHDIKPGLANFIQDRITPSVPKNQWSFIFVCPDTFKTLSCPQPKGGLAKLCLHQTTIVIPTEEYQDIVET
jgi:hypothetical protein